MAAQKEPMFLLSLPPFSRIVTPRAFTFIKLQDGVWYNWANGAYGNAFPLDRGPFPDGSQAYTSPNEAHATYVKRGEHWLRTQLPNGSVRASNYSAGPSASRHGHGSSAAPQILSQTPYHNGPVPADDLSVPFNVPMPAAENGQVGDGTRCAFTGELAVREKVSIRFGFPYIEASEYKPKQHNLQRAHVPINRGYLASLVAREVRNAMDALRRIGQPLTGPNGRPVAFEDLILVDVRRVSHGSVQPTIAVRGA
ncbi:hypothetical protein V8D89_002608 [Ganoderma adspersum]